MLFGIAIPTYKLHINYLFELLDTIASNNILPNVVSISCSSMESPVILKSYPFKVIITETNEYKNPSQNRNIAASKLDTDIISFIDGDDLSMPYRNDYILRCFNNHGSKIVCHDYSTLDKREPKTNLALKKFYINACFPNCPYPRNSQNHKPYHCAHVSLTKELFDKFKYNEDEKLKYREDSDFLYRIVNSGNSIDYIENKLSFYR